MLAWRGSPIILSTMSLSLYAYLHGELTPAVAFTTLGVLSSVQQVFSTVPALIVYVLSSKLATSAN